MPRDIPLLFFIGGCIEPLRHMAGLARLPLLGRFGVLPIADGLGFRHSGRSQAMAGQAQIRLLEEIQILRIVRLALEVVFVPAEDRSTGLQLHRRGSAGLRRRIDLHRLDQMALNTADAFEGGIA